MDWLRWVGDLLANSFPELKPVVHSYPIQLRPAVGDDELHRACLHEFSNEAGQGAERVHRAMYPSRPRVQ